VLNQSKDLSLVFLRAVIKNYEILIEKSWDVTKLYAEMEKNIKDEPLMSKPKKDSMRFKYEK
jgi:hypothetical protein